MMPWFPRNFLGETRGWSVTAKGVYRELLDAQWDMGALPADPEELRVLIGATPEEWTKGWAKACQKFTATEDGRLINLPLEENRNKATELAERRAQGAHTVNAKRGAGRNGQRTDSATQGDLLGGAPTDPLSDESGAERDGERDGERAHTSTSTKKKEKKLPESLFPEGFQLTPELERYILQNLPGVDSQRWYDDWKLKAKSSQWKFARWDLALMTHVRNCAPGSGHWAENRYPKKATAPINGGDGSGDDPWARGPSRGVHS
jgi:uncharacterized protein YdaU (DUF1376 family)